MGFHPRNQLFPCQETLAEGELGRVRSIGNEAGAVVSQEVVEAGEIVGEGEEMGQTILPSLASALSLMSEIFNKPVVYRF